MYKSAAIAAKKIVQLDRAGKIIVEQMKGLSANDNGYDFLNEALQKINAMRKRQHHRIYQHNYYMEKRKTVNQNILNVGMAVYFYTNDGRRRMGVIQKKCPKTFIVNENDTNAQWQISFGLVKAVRRHLHKAS